MIQLPLKIVSMERLAELSRGPMPEGAPLYAAFPPEGGCPCVWPTAAPEGWQFQFDSHYKVAWYLCPEAEPDPEGDSIMDAIRLAARGA